MIINTASPYSEYEMYDRTSSRFRSPLRSLYYLYIVTVGVIRIAAEALMRFMHQGSACYVHILGNAYILFNIDVHLTSLVYRIFNAKSWIYCIKKFGTCASTTPEQIFNNINCVRACSVSRSTTAGKNVIISNVIQHKSLGDYVLLFKYVWECRLAVKVGMIFPWKYAVLHAQVSFECLLHYTPKMTSQTQYTLDDLCMVHACMTSWPVEWCRVPSKIYMLHPDTWICVEVILKATNMHLTATNCV